MPTALANAIAGTCFNGPCCCRSNCNSERFGNYTVTVTAITKGTGANADALATNNGTAININGIATANIISTLGAGTGTLGTNGSNIAPNFQYWSGAAAVSTAVLAANIAAAITAAEQIAAGISLSYTAGNTFLTISGAGSNAGATGNSVAIGGTLTGFAWSPSGHLRGRKQCLDLDISKRQQWPDDSPGSHRHQRDRH